ncbi:uncharacterized integrin beta-like protein C05D9.3 [Zophobas morio]|uniref:uncharacterized integrin beta-like protein C05D9.3 n=1 Tax=Zophobas morio TaxID=2755281 RepID=UPI003082EEB6
MWNKIAITLFVLTKLKQVHCIDDCSSLRTCQQCMHAPSCGWYLQYRTVNGSGCFKKDRLDLERRDATKGYVHPPKSSLYVISSRGNEEFAPQAVFLNLRLGETFAFPITFTPQRPSWGKRAVELQHNYHKPRIKLAFFSDCGGQHEEAIETSQCDNVEFGKSVEFVVKVQQVVCAKRQPEKIKTVEISAAPSGATFRLNLYVHCNCPCEMEGTKGNPELPEEVPGCRGRGEFVCGVCYCNEGWAGDSCEINTTNVMT